MWQTVALGLVAAAGVGVLAQAVQAAVLAWHLRPRFPGARRAAGSLPRISVLKPLCGVDDGLRENLASFAALDYPDGRWEVLLGVRDARDPAHALAREAEARWPGVFRLVLQEGEPGLNPKVNQLLTLERAVRAARGPDDVLVVSDSNMRVPPGYLRDVARAFEDPRVACASHLVVGAGAQRLGSLLDTLHLASSVAPGQVAAKRLAGRDIVVGKSMALRRADLAALGGFAAVKDVLAEDYVLGAWVARRLGRRCVLGRARPLNMSLERGVGDFWRRYARWSVIHRTAIPLPLYLAQALLNPAPLAWAAALLAPSRTTLALALGLTGVRVLLDVGSWLLLGARPAWSAVARAVPACVLKDALLLAAWARGLVCRTVDWRGTRLRVHAGSRLQASEPVRPLSVPAPQVDGAAGALLAG